MKKSRFSEEQIAGILAESRAGVPTVELCRRHGVSQKTFLARRWIVERTLAWFNAYRRLAKDVEIVTSSAENFVMIAHSMLLLKRLNKS